MVLIRPTSNNQTFQVSENNLNQILSLNIENATPDQLITSFAKECFDKIKESELGFSFYLKKQVLGLAVNGSMNLVPIGLLGGASYYAYQDLGKFASFEHVSPALGLTGSVATLIAVNEVFNKVTGFRPFNMMLLMTYDTWRTFSKRVSGEFLDSYDRQAQSIEIANLARHKNGIEDLIETYKGIGGALVKKYEKEKNNPRALLEIKKDSARLLENLPNFESKLMSFKLSETEISEILTPLKDLLILINKSLVIRNAKNISDSKFNTELLVALDDKLLSESVIAESALKDIAEAERHELGLGHSIKKVALSSLWGVCAAAFSVLGVNILAANTTIPFVPAVIVTAPTVMHLVSSKVRSIYSKERDNFDQIYNKKRSNAVRELTAIYDGIAEYLQSKEKLLKNGKKRATLDEFEVQKLELRQKLGTIQAKLSSIKIIENPGTITKKLEEVLKVTKT